MATLASNNPLHKGKQFWAQLHDGPLQQWLDKRIPKARSVALSHRNIFLLPSKQGVVFFFVLALLFIGASNYEISLAYSLVFWLLSLFLLSIFYTYRNFAGMEVSAVTSNSVFVGEKAEVTVIMNRKGERQHESLQVRFNGSKPQTTDLLEHQEQRVNLYVDCEQRGYFNPGRLIVETWFPLGLVRAWTLLDLALNCIVYPKPHPCDIEWLLNHHSQNGATKTAVGNDDYESLRDYRAGDSLKHVAWKNFARGQGMHTKEYATHVDEKIWLHWDLFEGQGVEMRLSQLCWCVIQLDAAGVEYGLKIPGVTMEPGKGPQHYQQALMSLALFDQVIAV